MSLSEWLETQGFPHGFECIGIERMQQVWDAAQEEEREACAKVCEDTGQEYEPYIGTPKMLNYTCADAIRMRSEK